MKKYYFSCIDVADLLNILEVKQMQRFWFRNLHQGSASRLVSGLCLGVHVVDQINDSVAVAILVVVPGHQLHEGSGELDAGLGVKD